MSHLPPLAKKDRVVFTDKTDNHKFALLNCSGIVVDLFGSDPRNPGHFKVNFGQLGVQSCAPAQLDLAPQRQMEG